MRYGGDTKVKAQCHDIKFKFDPTTCLYNFLSTSELRVRLAPLSRFKPSRKIFYWPFQGGSSFVDILCFFLSCVCYALVSVCLNVPCGHLLGRGWPLGSRMWCPTVSLSLSHWYPGSGVVLDFIDSGSLHIYLLVIMVESMVLHTASPVWTFERNLMNIIEEIWDG